MFNIFDSKESLVPVEETRGMIRRDQTVWRGLSNLDNMVNTLGIKIGVTVKSPEPSVEYPQPAEIARSSTHDMANVILTGTTKNPAEDLALQRVYEIHDDAGRQG